MSYALSLQQDLAGGGHSCSPAAPEFAACIQVHLRTCLLTKLFVPFHAPGLKSSSEACCSLMCVCLPSGQQLCAFWWQDALASGLTLDFVAAADSSVPLDPRPAAPQKQLYAESEPGRQDQDRIEQEQAPLFSRWFGRRRAGEGSSAVSQSLSSLCRMPACWRSAGFAGHCTADGCLVYLSAD